MGRELQKLPTIASDAQKMGKPGLSPFLSTADPAADSLTPACGQTLTSSGLNLAGRTATLFKTNAMVSSLQAAAHVAAFACLALALAAVGQARPLEAPAAELSRPVPASFEEGWMDGRWVGQRVLWKGWSGHLPGRRLQLAPAADRIAFSCCSGLKCCMHSMCRVQLTLMCSGLPESTVPWPSLAAANPSSCCQRLLCRRPYPPMCSSN